MTSHDRRELRPKFSLNTMLFGMTLLSATPAALADGVDLGRIYDPYVQPLEKEFEYQTLYSQDDAPLLDGVQTHLISFGASLSESWYAEVGLEATDSEHFQWTALELEAKWQLTEQGEYGLDWGLLFEYEDERESHIHELSSSVILLKELGRWVSTVNAGVTYEWGEGIKSEWETHAAAQVRYRHHRLWEPGFELFLAQNSNAAGPIITGRWRLQKGRSLQWETGLLLGVDSETPDTNLKFSLEYEFY